MQRRDDRFRRHRVHHVHAAARQQRGIELERRILGRRADEHDHAFFDVRQERILLHLVEAVHFVDEQNGADALRKIRRRLAERFAHVGQSGQHRGNRLKARVGVFRQQQRQRRLAATRRTPQDHRMHVPGLDRPTQRRIRSEQALLPDDLVEVARPHAFGERLQRFGLGEQRCGLRWRLAARHRCIICQRFVPESTCPMSNTASPTADDARARSRRSTRRTYATRSSRSRPNRRTRPRSRSASRRIGGQYPWLAASAGGRVIGYAYACENRSRLAYRWSVDAAVYLHASAQRAGIGRGLYQRLFALLRTQGYVNAFAGISLPNAASVGLHEAMGFTLIGVYRSVGYKLGAWRDVGWWQLALQDPPANPPEPLAFEDLDSVRRGNSRDGRTNSVADAGGQGRLRCRTRAMRVNP